MIHCGSKNRAHPSCFPNQDFAEASCFLFVQSWPFVWHVQCACRSQPSSCVCLSPQNTTDSSSNSSQKLESSLQPLESSPLPQRHKCMLGHRHDLHDSYRLSDHYFLDQVRRWAFRAHDDIRVEEQRGSTCRLWGKTPRPQSETMSVTNVVIKCLCAPRFSASGEFPYKGASCDSTVNRMW